MNATSLHGTTVLDKRAMIAERKALLAELLVERFGQLRCPAFDAPYAKEAAAVLHLRKTAAIARELADAERDRCARTYQGGAA